MIYKASVINNLKAVDDYCDQESRAIQLEYANGDIDENEKNLRVENLKEEKRDRMADAIIQAITSATVTTIIASGSSSGTYYSANIQ